MKILYIAAESADFVIRLCNKFCEKGHEVTCVTQESDAYDLESSLKGHENLTRINMSFKDILNPNKVKTRLLTSLNKQKFDVVFGSHAPVSEAVRDIGIMTGSPWGVMLLDIPSDLMVVQRKRMIEWVKWFDVLKYANNMIFNTYVARDEYAKYTGQYFHNNNVIPYATNMPPEFDLAGKGKKGDYVVSVCRLTNMKNCKAIASALAQLDGKIGYHAIGRDSGELRLIKEICKKHGVPFKHSSMITEKEKFEIIRDSSLLIYPQATEYIGGLSPFEGMFVGKPVLAFDFQILKDLFGDNVYYAEKSIDSLARNIAFLTSVSPSAIEQRIIDANRYAKYIASFDNMADGMLKVFERMVIEK